MTETNSKIDTQVAHGSSRVVLYELIDAKGRIHGPFNTIVAASLYAEHHWQTQSQDEDRTGKGWDIQVEGVR